MSRPSVRLDPEEAWEVVEASHTGILTSLRRDGRPVALPVWFVVDEGRIWLSTPARAKKVARLRHDPRGSFLVESGRAWAELRAVHLPVTATVVEDPEVVARVDRRKGEKYAASQVARRRLPDTTRAHYSAGRVAIALDVSDRILTWDNSRIPVATEDTP